MSFRELRNFTEMLRSLGFTRQVSVENFRQPNFELVAEILIWLIKRFDPHVSIPTDIDMESDRVIFIKAAAEFLATKAHVRVNTKKLYGADGYAVQELIKAVSVLYNAMKTKATSDESGPEVSLSAFDVSRKLNDIKETRRLASEITSRGATLYELLGSEVDLREERNLSLARGLEIDKVEGAVRQSIAAINDQIKNTLQMMDNLAGDEASLTEKIEKKKLELDRNQKRLKSLQAVRPAFMDEYEKLEAELAKVYEVYIEKFRNLSFLENQLEEYNRAEQDKFEETEVQLKRMQARLREEEMKLMRGEEDAMGIYDDAGALSDEEPEDRTIRSGAANAQGKGSARGGSTRRSAGRKDRPQVKGSMQGGEGSDLSGSEDLGSSEESSEFLEDEEGEGSALGSEEENEDDF